MAHNTKTVLYKVTKHCAFGGPTIPAMMLTADEVRACLLGGDVRGQHVGPSATDLTCETCGDTAAWCPDLKALLPLAYLNSRLERAAVDA